MTPFPELKLFTPHDSLPAEVQTHWTEGWRASRIERQVSDQNPSLKSLTEQNQILVLFYENQIAASVCHRFVHLGESRTYQHEYFQKGWRSEDIQLLSQLNAPAVIGSQILVEPAFRGKDLGWRARDLISYCSFSLLSAMDVRFVIGTMRTNRGMGALFLKAGARLIRARISHESETQNENDLADLVYFDLHQQPFIIPLEYQLLCDELLSGIDSHKEKERFLLLSQERKVA